MIRSGTLQGHPVVWLENEALQVAVLPAKGADIYQLLHRASGVDFLYKTKGGLASPGASPATSVIENYEGAWQELFPNTGDACAVDGVHLPLHGEAALKPWDWWVVLDDAAEPALGLSVDVHALPLHLERRMRLRQQPATLEVEETVSNRGERPANFVWGHHIMLGGTFLEAGCRYEPAARTIVVPPVPKLPARARLAPGQRSPWPWALAREPGAPVDLRMIPGPEVQSHDEVYLTDLDRGAVVVTNPRLGLAFHLTWDARIFGCLVMWQPFGGVDVWPWADSYGVGVEPWTAPSNLAGALAAGQALRLDPGEALTTALRIEIIAIGGESSFAPTAA